MGTPKSGTTYLQAVLWDAAEALQDHGVLLPGRRTTQRAAAYGIIERRTRRPREVEDPATAWAQICEQVGSWPGDAVISEELLAGAGPRQAALVRSAFEGAQIHVVITARALYRQLPSSWQEQVKAGFSQPLDAFLRDVRRRSGPLGSLRRANPHARWCWLVQNVPAVARRWGADLPPEQVHVVTVPPRASDPTVLWRRTAAVLGVDPGVTPARVEMRRVSLGRVEIELLRRVHAARDPRFTGPAARHWTRALLAHQVLASRPGGEPTDLPAAAGRWVRARMSAIADGVADAGYAVAGDLADLSSWPDSLRTGRTAVSEEEIEQAAQWTIDRLGDMLADRATGDQAAGGGQAAGVPGVLEMLARVRAAEEARAARGGRRRPPGGGRRPGTGRLARSEGFELPAF